VYSDEQKLRQVLINLLSNAVKFTDEGKVMLRVSVPEQDDTSSLTDLPHYRFEISDTGIGITPEDQTAILEPFRQVGIDSSTEGTGLGLTISQRMIELLGGVLYIESELGRGSRFWFTVPIAPSEALSWSKVQGENAAVTGLAEGYSVRALVVDDIKENHDVLYRLLTDIGCDVRLDDDGQSALEAIQKAQPDIVLMDIRMPNMDGTVAVRKIIETWGTDAMKLLAVSASAFAHNKQRYLDGGFDDFISKPFKANEIYECLARLLQVEYLYDNTPTDILEADSISLPPELLTHLTEAAEYGDLAALETAFERLDLLGDVEQRLAERLRQLSENIDMQAIKSVLQRIEYAGNKLSDTD
jgi:CheY-like chemotaxis protein